MAKARGPATVEAPREAALDASMEHPALTPLVRRLAGELWEIVRAKAEAEELPIEKAWLLGYTDVEGVDEACVAVLCAAPAEMRGDREGGCSGHRGDKRGWPDWRARAASRKRGGRVRLRPRAYAAPYRNARACAYADGHAHANARAHSDARAHGDAYPYPNSHAHAHLYPNGHSHRDAYSYGDAHAAPYAHADAPANAKRDAYAYPNSAPNANAVVCDNVSIGVVGRWTGVALRRAHY